MNRNNIRDQCIFFSRSLLQSVKAAHFVIAIDNLVTMLVIHQNMVSSYAWKSLQQRGCAYNKIGKPFSSIHRQKQPLI
jgi:hypothetical protein